MIDIYEVKVFTKDERQTVTAIVRADNAPKAVIKTLEITPGLTEFYKIEVKERPDVFIVD
jgi:hypothetical protein